MLLDSFWVTLIGILIAVFLLYVSRYYLTVGIDDITDDYILFVRGFKREIEHKIYFKDIKQIDAIYGSMISMILKITLQPRRCDVKCKSIKLKIDDRFFRPKRFYPLSGESWEFVILNRLSEKCPVYARKFGKFRDKKKKWTPVDVWVPFEMRDKQKNGD